MRETNLRSVDLNLLVILEALLDARHVSKAAQRLNMSQPAVSRALQRLRETFNDPLLVRTVEGYDLSARAEELLPQLDQVLKAVDTMVRAPSFDPQTASNTIRLSALDLETALYMPQLSRFLQTAAPSIHLEIVPQQEDHFQQLDQGDIHYVMTALEPAYGTDQFHRMEIDRTPVVCLMDESNPLAKAPLSVSAYSQGRHGMVSITGRGPGVMDDVLAQQGVNRQVHLRLASFLSVADFCENTDLIFTLPQRLAERIAYKRSLVVKPLPTELAQEDVSFYLYWHSRYHRDPLCQWLRAELSKILHKNRD